MVNGLNPGVSVICLVLVSVGAAVKRIRYQRKVDVDMLNAVKCVLADVSPSSEQIKEERLLSVTELSTTLAVVIFRVK